MNEPLLNKLDITPPLIKSCDIADLFDDQPISNAAYVIIDLETTGLDIETCDIVEIAAYAQDSTGRPLGMISTYVDPEKPIPPASQAIHHITDEDVAGAPTIQQAITLIVLPFLDRLIVGGRRPVLVAQNAEYDRPILLRASTDFHTYRDWLCTKRMAQKIWPSLESYSNQNLRYTLGNGKVGTFGLAPHRALADCIVTASLLVKEILHCQLSLDGLQGRPVARTVGDLRTISNTLRKVDKLPFKSGKYLGKSIKDIAREDARYLKWVLSEAKVDEDTLWSIEEALS